MHELGIVFHVIDMVEKAAAENQAAAVASVTLELGEVSGVVPDYLTDCWRWAAALPLIPPSLSGNLRCGLTAMGRLG